MKSDKTRELVELSLYAALIIVSVQFIRIPFGPQFVHLGNALVDRKSTRLNSSHRL